MRGLYLQIGGVAAALAALSACGGGAPSLPDVSDPCALWEQPGLYRMSMDGFDRRPFVFVPSTAGARAAVVMMHGLGGDADRMMNSTTRLLDMAEEGQFVAVFPNGSGTPSGLSWNAGGCCGAAELVNAEDVAFLDAIAANLRSRVCVDRVVGAGHSNGGMMAARWACEGTGVGAIYSSSGATLVSDCASGSPVPVTLTHGQEDRVVPVDGGSGIADKEPFVWPSQAESIAPFLERNGCEGEPSVTKVSGVTCQNWTCEVPTRACEIGGWGHEWPGGQAGPEGLDAETEIARLVAALGPDDAL